MGLDGGLIVTFIRYTYHFNYDCRFSNLAISDGLTILEFFISNSDCVSFVVFTFNELGLHPLL